ncbi:MAG: bifunctional hydroxymethylpyrimidine kinase/phosphomethylpyrimidine kinase [Sutterellaceae bacterium]|nr:bifunctional hydroxymethylpyrimidine kinase/phosphomethylpyrimidine kinase [Sutterellaceae bacterium]MDY2868659.1 bifunctional hydroxymethylpyrimidine kinase/phosphomethylpyrimidine kinase [Mesosutterella sp.]
MEIGAGRQVLLIADEAGYGKVGLSAMQPVLSHLGCNLYNLPTALISNTFNYGKYAVLDTTSYMRKSIGIWDELGFRFDAIATGFMSSLEQAELVRSFCERQRARGALILTDPVMADEGELYKGLPEETVTYMRRLLPVSDFIVPNFTEACCLAGVPWTPDPVSPQDMESLVGKLRALGARSVVVTSAEVSGLGHAVCCWDDRAKRTFTIPYDYIPVFFPGTGDIFSSVFLGRTLEGWGMEKAVRSAMDAVRELVRVNRGNEDKFKGVQVESCLSVIDETAPHGGKP